MEENTYYSLCITVETKNQKTGNSYWKLLRIADLPMNEENKGSKQKTFLPYGPESDVPQHPELSMAPNNARPNELRIWEWWIEGEKIFSEPSNETFYELIFPENIGPENISTNKLPVPSILDKLLNGLPRSGEQLNPFLFVISWSNEEYICIEITKENSRYISQENIVKIPEGTIVKLYRISAADCIDSLNISQSFERKQKNQTVSPITRRRIYKRIRLRDSLAELKVQSFDKCLAEYLNQALFASKYTAGQKQIITNFFISETNTDDSFPVFLQRYYNYSETSSELTDLFVKWYNERRATLDEFASTGNKMEKFLTALVEGTPELRKKYCDYIQKDLIEEKMKISKEIEILETEKLQLLQNIELSREQMRVLEEKETKLNEHNTKISSEIFNKLDAFREMLTLLGHTETKITPSLSNVQRDVPGLTLKTSLLSQNDDKEIENLTSCEESVGHLCDNLEEIGITSSTNNATDISHLVVGSHLSHLPILVIGSQARKAAEIISYSLTAEIPETICLSAGFSDYTSLNHVIRDITTEYVILDNVVGSTEEYCYLHLSEEFPEKRFIYTLEFVETLALMPMGIYGHFLIINTEKYLQYPSHAPIILPGQTNCQDFITDKDDKIIQKKLQSELGKLLQGSLLPQRYLVTRLGILQNITATMDDVDKSIEMLLAELVDIGNFRPYPEEYIDMLQTNGTIKLGKTFARYLTENEI
ncbi:hypothetical protein [Methanorbis rubei]|uniref:Uncharacterized protein n=1 Tax=Methanorbis rubei TaxID=3028300 RepID=A0AAE4MGD3_9EURY|nr:hypothetical protein [Methanocorpusculaceae archaeon Cs1]